MYAVTALYYSCGLLYRTKGKRYVYYLAWGGLKYVKNGISCNGSNTFLFIYTVFIVLTELVCVPFFFFMELCFHLLLLISVHNQTGVSVHVRPVI